MAACEKDEGKDIAHSGAMANYMFRNCSWGS
jgi:hypothetical protein